MQDDKYNDDHLTKEQNFEQNFSKLDIIGKPLSIGGYCKEHLTGDYRITTQKKMIHQNDMSLVLLFLILIGVLLFWWKIALFKLLLFIFV
jgi:hypothetical protein